MTLDKPFRGSDAIAAGLTTRRQLAGARFRRLGRDTYVSAHAVLDDHDRVVAAVLAVPGAVVGGYTAATLLDAPCAPRHAPTELIVGRRRVVARSDLMIHQEVLTERETVVCDGVTVTRPQRTAFDLARRLDHDDAVVAVDALAHRWGFDVASLLDYPTSRTNPRGTRALPSVVADADARAASPPETRTRLVLGRSRLPAPSLQHVVLDEVGRFVARTDFAWPDLRVALEYQGDGHRTDRRQWARDVTRTADLVAVGWVVVPVTAYDLFVDPEGLIQRIGRALAGRARELGRRAA